MTVETPLTPVSPASLTSGLPPPEVNVQVADLDASKLTITLAEALKPIPAPESLVFGQTTTTDHMLIVTFDPLTGWSAPEIKPYAPLSLDPACSCFHYCTNAFEGLKAYLGPDGRPRLFRPDKNMERFARSTERVALPSFNTDALLTLIKRLILVDICWIPKLQGYSLYIRPTIIGTRPALGVAASDHAILYVILSPTGPYPGPQAISLLADSDNVRSWPGGTGGHKLGLNYAPGFLPQKVAVKEGYDLILWLLGEDKRITEAGAMNFFVVVQRDDGDLDVITPPLDGTILPGVTRASCLSLAEAHTSQRLTLPYIHPSTRLYTHECILTMHDLSSWSAQGRLLEAFGVGTGVIVAPVGKIGFEGKDLTLEKHPGGLGPVGKSLWERIVDIQEARVEWEGWSVPCE